jgi:hypothetical protein
MQASDGFESWFLGSIYQIITALLIFTRNFMSQDAIRKIKMQIKFGRVIEANMAIQNLLKSASDSEKMELLPIYIDLDIQRGRHENAITSINQCLSLTTDTNLIKILREKLSVCEREVAKVESGIDCTDPNLCLFIEAIPVFLKSTTTKLNSLSFNLVNDFNKAKECAHNQNISPPFYSWNGAREKAAKEIFSHAFSNKIRLGNFDKKCRPLILQACERYISKEHRGCLFFDDIVGDLKTIALGLALKKMPQLVFKMKQAYESHLFPCGWMGSYPEGELVVYQLW